MTGEDDRGRGRLRLSRRCRGNGGFSLVEMMVAMTLMLVILAAIYGIWFGLQRTYSFTEDDLNAQEQARIAMNEMVELLRTARCPDPAPSEDLRLVIVSASPNSILCWTDVDRDPDHELELVRFRVDQESRTLYRDTSATGDPSFSSAYPERLVSHWVTNDEENPLFSYTGMNGSPLPMSTTEPIEVLDPTQIREVTINLFIDVVVEQAPIRHHLRSVVQPRNLRQY